MDVVDALDASEGMTCLVGAGGKKTTLYALATRTDRAVLTATVRIPIFDGHVARVVTTPDPVAALEGGPWPLGLVPERDRADRYLGYGVDRVDALAAAHDGPVLVKADGARTREFKAPGDDEPQVPPGADTVVPVASAHVVGEPLTEAVVHRPERVAAITDIDPGETVTAEAVGRVLAHDAGGLKGVPDGARAVALVNKVDDDGDLAVAREIAASAHEEADGDLSRVVLARMAGPEVVEVLE